MTSPKYRPPRELLLRKWMVEHNITFRAWAEKLGVTKQLMAYTTRKETMPTHLYEKSIVLGFPSELLPLPMDKKKGRKPSTPFFPGLAEENIEHNNLKNVYIQK